MNNEKRIEILRLVLVLDSAALILLGLGFLLFPNGVAIAFGFRDLPAGVHYIIGLWGCALLTMAIGYFHAAVDPVRHAVWVQVGIARGTLEVLLGLVYVARGVVSWQQAWFGIVIAGMMAIAYAAFYPRTATAVENSEPVTAS